LRGRCSTNRFRRISTQHGGAAIGFVWEWWHVARPVPRRCARRAWDVLSAVASTSSFIAGSVRGGGPWRRSVWCHDTSPRRRGCRAYVDGCRPGSLHGDRCRTGPWAIFVLIRLHASGGRGRRVHPAGETRLFCLRDGRAPTYWERLFVSTGAGVRRRPRARAVRYRARGSVGLRPHSIPRIPAMGPVGRAPVRRHPRSNARGGS